MAKYLIEFPEGREYFPDLLPTDNFYSGIYIAPEHMNAWAEEFPSMTKAGISLIEEMSELTKEICKLERDKGSEAKIAEEAAHVLISLKGFIGYLPSGYMAPELIESKIQEKWPAAYEPKKGECKDCYWSMKTRHDNGVVELCCVARCGAPCNCCGPCNGFAKKEEKK